MASKYIKKELEIGGKTLTLEINRLAPQANASVIARYGDTEVLATVVSTQRKTNQGFFPLTIDFVERLYAGGIIKGSRWVKREGRPTDEAILTGRLVDRSLRPLFPKDLLDEVQITITLLSTDGENDHDVLSVIAASAALSVSDIPWNGPVGTVRLGYITQPEEKGLVVNPHVSEMDYSDLDLIVSATKDGIIMIEAGAKQLLEEKALAALAQAQEETEKIIKFLEEIRDEAGQEKYSYEPNTLNKELLAEIEKEHADKLLELVTVRDPSQMARGKDIEEYKNTLLESYGEHQDKTQIPQIVEEVIKKRVRKLVLDKKQRSDGRTPSEIRPVTAEVGILPRTHGSALFQRGNTQILSVVTLASPSLVQWIETAEGMEEKRYLHHYSDPPYSHGETGRLGTPGRREIGHGALAERALETVIPTQDKFPYTIRVVSEVLSSNGSTSMGSTCGSTLALMDAGVPIVAPVSGLAMGLTAEGPDKYVILSDIRGLEDFYGNMDFKVAGTKNGLTSLQLDVKLDGKFRGLTKKMVEEILPQAREGRLLILERMLGIIPESRKDVSRFAPKVITRQIPVEKIGELIGPGGKNIRNIIASSGASVDVDDKGTVTIAAVDPQAVEQAARWVDSLTREVTPGEEFEGEVKRILPFGAFVEILPGKEGLVHVSRMTAGFVSDPNTVVKIGQKVKVKVSEIDEMGRINLSMHWASSNQQPQEARQQYPGAKFTGVGQRGRRPDRFRRNR